MCEVGGRYTAELLQMEQSRLLIKCWKKGTADKNKRKSKQREEVEYKGKKSSEEAGRAGNLGVALKAE